MIKKILGICISNVRPDLGSHFQILSMYVFISSSNQVFKFLKFYYIRFRIWPKINFLYSIKGLIVWTAILRWVTTSRLICEVKQRQARVVLRWVTTGEVLVLFILFYKEVGLNPILYQVFWAPNVQMVQMGPLGPMWTHVDPYRSTYLHINLHVDTYLHVFFPFSLFKMENIQGVIPLLCHFLEMRPYQP